MRTSKKPLERTVPANGTDRQPLKKDRTLIKQDKESLTETRACVLARARARAARTAQAAETTRFTACRPIFFFPTQGNQTNSMKHAN